MLIYEKNDIEIKELHRGRGHYRSNPLEKFYTQILSDMKFKDFSKYFYKYYGEKVGMDLTNFPKEKIKLFFDYLQYATQETSLGINKLIKYDLLNGFAYFLGDKLYKLKSGGFGLSYFIYNEGSSKMFYFFDTVMKLFIGHMEILKTKLNGVKGNVFDVQNSAAERKLIGLGYGIKMYMTLLENCDYLISSGVLFSGSYRIWSQTLPKYSNVWWKDSSVDTGTKSDYNLIDPNKTFDVKARKIDYFVASIYHNKI